jgi:capsular exopolysaccharide synthesis family protein
MSKELKHLKRDERLPKEVKKLNPSLWLIFDPLSYVAESFRRLRTNLLRMQVERPIKTIVLTSPNPEEGKSTTISNLAIALAETQKRILLVDADLRRPTLHTNFGVPLLPGLTDHLAGKASLEQIIKSNIIAGLDVVPCGTVFHQPARVIASSAMESFLIRMREVYDFVLIDAPPILIVNDAALIGGAVDGVILTVAAGETRIAALERAREFVERAGGRMLGIVLNRFDARHAYGVYYGGHRYGHYGTYDSHYGSNGEKSRIPQHFS